MKPIIGIGSDILRAEGHRDRAFVYITYAEALRRAGGMPLIVPPQPENIDQLLDRLDGLVLAGGDDCDPTIYGEEPLPSIEPMDARRQSNDLALARAARDRGLPTLGICLGLQVMNVAAGGSLIQDIDSQITTEICHASVPEERVRHRIIAERGTKLASIIGEAELEVNSSHHQAVKRTAEGMRVTAHAADGVIEGIEDARLPFYLGVQWHPEDMPEHPAAIALFAALVAAARAYAEEWGAALHEPVP